MRLTYGDLLEELKDGARVALMIRNAEFHSSPMNRTRRYAYIQLVR